MPVFKKVLQIVTAFGVLLASYATYVQVFAVVAARLGAVNIAQADKFRKLPSRTEQQAIDLATTTFGRKHWTANRELTYRYYNHERGYWMYAENYEKSKDGKQLTFTPFAVISVSPDGKGIKTVTSKRAVIDLNQPLGLINNKEATPLQVVHARVEGDVRIRDDKGTPAVLEDDLVIGPMTYFDYDEPTLQIKSESEVVIQERDIKITGMGLEIKLRPKDEGNPSATGFNGAETAFLQKDVHIVMNNAGSTGILPSKPGGEKGSSTQAVIDLRCSGQMKVELPKPKPKRLDFVGPPAPPQPTMVYFSRNVVVLQIKPAQAPDQLNCDNLSLTMLPASEAEGGGAKPPDEESSGNGGSGLTMRVAHATGHAVWLQSKSQGFVARCNGLIHKKLLPSEPDSTYLWADQNGKIRVDKTDFVKEGPDKGKVQSITTILTIDATIFEHGTGSENATVVARGPGRLETRPARDKPVERTATWQDFLVMQTDETPGRPLMRTIKLKGQPELIDPKQATLDANDEIIIVLKPKPKPPGKTDVAVAKVEGGSTESQPASSSESFQIEKLTALLDVHLNSPGKTMTARDRLDAEFEIVPTEPAAKPATPAAKPATPAASEPAASPGQPEGEAKPGEKKEPPPKETEPDVAVRANRVWALIRQHPDTKPAPGKAESGKSSLESSKSEIQLVRLRGNVLYHQDPAPGKVQGTDVTGEALDLTNLGNGKSKVHVIDRDPSKPISATELAMLPAAMVTTEDMKITGPIIGLDQSTDRAWVLGRGTLTQMAERGLFSEKGQDTPAQEKKGAQEKKSATEKKGAAKPATGTKGKVVAQNKGKEKAQKKTDDSATKRPMTISWDDEMRFFGNSLNPHGEPVAKAQFFKNVRASMEDAYMSCNNMMETYMDRIVVLSRPKQEPKPAEAEGTEEEAPEPKPQIAEVRCFEKVLVITRKLNEDDPRIVMQQQRIEGEKVAYEKLTGNFYVDSAGIVYLWNRDGEGDPNASPGSTRPGVARVPVTPTANPGPGGTPVRRTPAVIGRAGSTMHASDGTGASQAKGKIKGKAAPLPPLKLTQVAFSQGMKGRYLAGKDTDKTEIRWADFWGDVQALSAKVPDTSQPLKFDEPPEDGMFLTSQTMRVISEPSATGDGTSRNFLKAWENAQAKSRTESIIADVITYDSLKELFYAYALENHEVILARQMNVGQPFSTGNGEAVEYNRRTGESQIVGAQSMQIIDDKTGIRPGPAAEARVLPPKSPRAPLVLPGRSVIERRGMNGR